MKKVFLWLLIISIIGTFTLIGCEKGGAAVVEEEEAVVEEEEAVVAEEEEEAAETFSDVGVIDIIKLLGVEKPAEDLDVPRTKDIAFDPNGNMGVGYKTVVLTAEQQAKIKEKADSGDPYTAILAWHKLDTQFNTLQMEGAVDALEMLGIEVINKSDAQRDVDQQVANLQTHIEEKPDLMITIPVSEKITAEMHKQAAAAGIKLIAIDLCPFGLSYPDEIQGYVSATEWGNGFASGDYLCKEIGEKGTVATWEIAIYHFCTDQRVLGAKNAIANYGDIENVWEAETNFEKDPSRYQDLADAIIARFPDLDGLFTIAEYFSVMCSVSAKNAGIGPEDMAITSNDLNIGTVDNMFTGHIRQCSCSDPYTMGVTAAVLGAQAILGETGPFFVTVQGFSFTKDNIIEGYETFYRDEVPQEIKDLAAQ